MSIFAIPPVKTGYETAGTLAMRPAAPPSPAPYASGETAGSLASSSSASSGGGSFSAVA